MKIYFSRLRKDGPEQKPVIIDPADYERDPLTGKLVYKKPSFKEKLLLALELLGGLAFAVGLFVILLPIAVLAAAAILSLVIAGLAIAGWKLHKHRDEIRQWRLYLERLLRGGR